ncbi:MAG: M56 family metallopeptidase [Alphaproteobacteria bacterium]|nr:M56 family metallopeptidase [Alphaproteobacteria bacterium]
MSASPELAVAVGVLADAGLKATAVVAGAWVVNATALRAAPAAHRHVVWAAALGALPLLAVFAAVRGPAVAIDALWVAALWAAGVGVASVGPLRGIVGLARLTARARPDPEMPGVRYADALDSPLTWGVLRPVILLPSSAAGWSEGDRAAVLAHERAHVSRFDWLVHVASLGVATLFWFHPAVALARRALVREAEHAADDAALAAGIRPSDYAALLVSLGRAPTPSMALAMGRSEVGERVRAVLERRQRGARRRLVAVVASALALGSVAGMGAWPLWTSDARVVECVELP